MALMRQGLWSILDGTEIVPGVDSGERYAKFAGRHDLALAIVVLSVEPNLLYLLREPKDPSQFMKKSWGNKLELRRKLHSLRLNEGEPVQEHI